MKKAAFSLLAVVALLLLSILLIRPDLHEPKGSPPAMKPDKSRTQSAMNVPKLDKNFFSDHVQSVLNSRCVVCHACYDAPCQLKLNSVEGITRGANKEKVYHGTRLTAATPNRLFVDAQSTSEWRQRGFFPMINEKNDAPLNPKTASQASVLANMLLLKKQNPLPNTVHLPDNVDISLNRAQTCPTADEYSDYATRYPRQGMPFALPGLSEKEHDTLMIWLNAGNPVPEPSPLNQKEKDNVVALESFLNQRSLKGQLMGRYIYEHLFTSHLYFKSTVKPGQQPQFYTLVRSSTAPGSPVDVIATRRPFDDPGAKQFWYRLIPITATIVSKTHQPYEISDELIENWQSWFIEAKYTVASLPSYDPKIAANPLIAFNELPVNARYRFMLTRAENTIMGYIKGPVCRGQVALNVINDHFWVFFVDPDIAASPGLNAFYQSQEDNLRLPAEQESTALAVSWVEYAKRQGDYRRARTAFLKQTFKSGQHLVIDSIWDGDGKNENASLTIFRHFDNATVVKGLIGKPPKTAWIIDYALLERIHYLLVAGFDVYGNYGHQLMTRLYMDFLRMEGESNFLTLLPPDARRHELADWYQHAGRELTNFLEGDITPFDQKTGIVYHSAHPKQELYTKLKQYLAPVQPPRYRVESSSLSQSTIRKLKQLEQISGLSASVFPEITMLEVKRQSGENDFFTLIRNSAHYNVNSLFDENDRRNPQQDTLTLVHGLLGSYPDAFWRVEEKNLDALITAAKHVTDEQSYAELLKSFGVRRTAPDFWQFSDTLNQTYMRKRPITGGWLDYSRLENR